MNNEIEDITIGVIVVVYNSGKYLSSCIDSLLSQSRLPNKIIICNDASTDRSIDIINKYKETFPGLLEVVNHKENIGIYRNLNSGINVAGQDYISLIAGDDFWDKDKLLKELELIVNCASDYVFSGVTRFIDKNKTYEKTPYPDFKNSPETFLFHLLNRSFHPTSALFKRSVFEEIGVFGTSQNIYEDWDFSLRYVSRFKGVFSEKHTVYRRIHEESTSFKYEQKNTQKKYLFLVLEILNRHRILIKSLPKQQRDLLKKRYKKLFFKSGEIGVDKVFCSTLFNFLKIFYL